MKYPIIIIFLFIFLNLSLKGQDVFDLKELILSADSICLASHSQTDCVDIIDETGKKIDMEKYKIAYHEKINPAILIKVQRLDDSQRAEMINIITQKQNDRIIETCMCFIPLHSILVFNEGKVSYMDICFGCNTYAVGIGNSRIENLYLGIKVMSKLYNFFSINNFPFEIDM